MDNPNELFGITSVASEDNWIPKAGGISNHPIPIKDWIVTDTNHTSDDYLVVTLQDGRKYKRSYSYASFSPYGWEKVAV